MQNKIHIGSGQKVLPDDLVFFMADSNYTFAYFKTGKKILFSNNLKKIEDRFVGYPYFFRINRRYLINLSLTEWDFNDTKLTINGQNFINISRRRKALFQMVYNQLNQNV